MSVVVEKKGILLRLNRDSRSEDSPSTRQCLRLSTAPYGLFGKMNFYIANGVLERLKIRLHAWKSYAIFLFLSNVTVCADDTIVLNVH